MADIDREGSHAEENDRQRDRQRRDVPALIVAGAPCACHQRHPCPFGIGSSAITVCSRMMKSWNTKPEMDGCLISMYTPTLSWFASPWQASCVALSHVEESTSNDWVEAFHWNFQHAEQLLKEPPPPTG